MAVITFPLVRTMFLPSGSPAIGCILRVSGDLREVRCGAAGGEVYCIGEADILIEYMSGNGGSGLFPLHPPTDQHGGDEWQALIALPFQLCSAGTLPPDTPYRVNLGPLEWCMAAAHAVELETYIELSYAEEEGSIPVTAVAGDAPFVPAEAGYIMRPTAAEEKAKIKQGGEWNMVDFMDESQRAEQVAEQQTQRPVEIVNLGNDEEESHIQAAIIRALAEAENAIAAQTETAAADLPVPAVDETDSPVGVPEEAYTISMVFPELATVAPLTAETAEIAADFSLPAEQADDSLPGLVDSVLPPAGAGRSQAAQPDIGSEAEQSACDAAEDMPDWEDVPECIIDEDLARKEEQEAAPYIVKPTAARSVNDGDEEAMRESPAGEEKTASADELPLRQGPELVAATAVPAAVTMLVPSMPAVAEHTTEQATTPDAAAAEPERKKRRFAGLPGLHVQMDQSTIDVTAFKINIKL